MKTHATCISAVLATAIFVAFIFGEKSPQTTGVPSTVDATRIGHAAKKSPTTLENSAQTLNGESPGKPVAVAVRSNSSIGRAQIANTVAAIIDSRQSFLKLTPVEKGKIIEIVSDFLEKKSNIESGLVRAVSSEQNILTLEIPPYVVLGRSLRDEFQRELIRALGQERFEHIDDYLGEYFDVYFRGFGITKQTLRLARDRDTPEKYRIEWSATVVSGLTPSGAKMPGNNGWLGSSGTAIHSLESLNSGEYTAVGALLAKMARDGHKFPD